jgi:hypothetical protein
MKKILGLGSLVFVMAVLFHAPAYSGDRESCASAAADAYTESASRRLYSACINDDNLVFKTDRHKCALKAAKAKTDSASRRLYSACMN